MRWLSFPNSILVGLLPAGLMACGEPPASPLLVTGAEDLMFVVPGHEPSAHVPVGTRISEILPASPDVVWLATWEGLTRVPTTVTGGGGASAATVELRMNHATTDSLGILDGIERDESSGLLYLLRHPGRHPGEVTENHTVVEWDPAGRSAVRDWTVDLLSYDLHLAPGHGVLVTPLSGRRLWWVSFARDEAWPIDLPAAPDRPAPERTKENVDGGASYVRIGAILPGTGRAVVVEQGLPDRNRVWLINPESGQTDGFDLPRSCHYHGGVLAGDGRTLVLNAIEAVEVIDLPARVERAWIPLPARHFRVAVAGDGRTAYLTAPGADGEESRITVVDLKRKRVVAAVVVPARAEAIAIW